MKKILLTIILGISSLGFAMETEQGSNYNVMTLSEALSMDFFKEFENMSNDEMFIHIINDWNSNDIIHLTSGMTLDMGLDLFGEFFGLTDTENLILPKIELKRDLYLQVKDHWFLLSADLIEWRDPATFF